MRRVSSLAVRTLLIVVPALAACRGRGEVTVRDTEGRSFRVRCSGNAESCSLEPLHVAASSRPAQALLRATGRLVGVCDAAAPDTVHPADCRALVCNEDADCPPLPSLQAGACVGRHCVNPANPISSEDAVMLCLAGTGTGHDEPKQIERFALAMNCGEPCVVPAPCVR